MISPMSRRLLGAGALAALLLPVLLNLVARPSYVAEEPTDLGAAGPFELLAGGAPGRPISMVVKGGAFAWTYHYCLSQDVPTTEIVELRRIVDGQVISRQSDTVVLGPDHCTQGTAAHRVPIDAPPGPYELARHLVQRNRLGIAARSVLAAIPIEVTP